VENNVVPVLATDPFPGIFVGVQSLFSALDEVDSDIGWQPVKVPGSAIHGSLQFLLKSTLKGLYANF